MRVRRALVLQEDWGSSVAPPPEVNGDLCAALSQAANQEQTECVLVYFRLLAAVGSRLTSRPAPSAGGAAGTAGVQQLR